MWRKSFTMCILNKICVCFLMCIQDEYMYQDVLIYQYQFMCNIWHCKSTRTIITAKTHTTLENNMHIEFENLVRSNNFWSYIQRFTAITSNQTTQCEFRVYELMTQWGTRPCNSEYWPWQILQSLPPHHRWSQTFGMRSGNSLEGLK